jgi:alpha-L-fucosidase 2
MKSVYYFLFILCCSATCLFAQNKQTNFDIRILKNSIYDGVFTGNGLLGTLTFQKSANILQINLGRTDVYDHRIDRSCQYYVKKSLPERF